MQSADKSKSKRTLTSEKRFKNRVLRRFYRQIPVHPSLKFTIRMMFLRVLTLVKGIVSRPVPTAARGSARSRKATYKILVIGLATPQPDRDAGSVRTVNFFRHLIDLGAEITFIPEQDLAYVPNHTSALERLGVRCLYFPKIFSVRNFMRKHMAEFDVVVLERIAVAHRYQKLVRKNSHNVPIIFDTQDLHHLRAARQAELNGSIGQRREADRLKIMEFDAIRHAEMTFVVSQYEQELIRAATPKSSVEVIPLLVEPSPLNEAFEHRQGVLFLGGFHHAPNADAVLHFVQHVWPAIEKALPQSVFYVVGSDPPAEIEALQSDRIEVMGFVEDIEPILARCRLSVAPLRFGAGVKGKIATSLSYGLPCVVSPPAIEGSGLTPEQDILLAENDELFARQVIRLHEDKALWEQLSKNGVAFVAENYSADAVRPKLQELLDRLMKERTARLSA